MPESARLKGPRSSTWTITASRWLKEERLALLIAVFAVGLQFAVGARMFKSGELAGDDMSTHLAEIAGISRSLASGELDLWNPSANSGFASGYFYQFLPQLVCACASLVFGWLLSLSTILKISVFAALLALPLTSFRAMRVLGAKPTVAAAAGLGASTVYAASGWGAGIDSLFSTGLYTQAFALAFYPLALAYAARYLMTGHNYGRAVLYTLLTGFCHPFIALAIAPPLLFVPWWQIPPLTSVRRAAWLALGALAGSAPLWLPIIVDYDDFGGFPSRVAGEEGIAYGQFLADFRRGAYLDVGRRSLTTALLVFSLPCLLLRSGRALIPLYLAGALFAVFIVLGPVIGKTEGDLVPAVRFLGPMQVFFGAAAWAGGAVAVHEALAQIKKYLGQRTARLAATLALAVVVAAAAAVLASGSIARAHQRVRTVNSFEHIDRGQMAEVISFLATQPRGRVLAASEFGSGSHWWMYLPYVYADRPAMRAYGGAALQSSPNYIYLRNADLFRHLSTFGTRYLVARTDRIEDRYPDELAALEGRVIFDTGEFRVYELDDAALFRAVEPVGVLAGTRREKNAAIEEWMNSFESRPDRALVEGPPLGDVASPTEVTIFETRSSRRSHAAKLEVNGPRPALLRLAVTFHPGWQATIDGVAAPVRRVSPAFVAVLVPGGAHEVRFTFTRPAWTWLLYLGLFASIAGFVFFQRRRRLGAAAVVVLFALVASPGSANAQVDSYPRPVDAAFDQNGRAIIATSAGLFVRKRTGDAFSYVCPEAGGTKPGAFAPRVAIRGDGTFFATSYAGLRESVDGCSTSPAAVGTADRKLVRRPLWFADVTAAPPNVLIAASADPRELNDLYRSGLAGEPLWGVGLASDRFWFLSVAVSPSGSVVYASGYMVAGRGEAEVQKLLVVGDRVGPAIGLEAGRSGRLHVALAASDHEVFVVAEGAREPNGDVLYRSTDRAVSFTPVLAVNGPIVGVVRDPSGATWVASESAVFRSEPGQATFASIGVARLSCLVANGDEIVACHRDAPETGVLLSRIEAPAGVLRATPILKAAEIGAPCGEASQACAADWQRVCSVLSADCAASPAAALPIINRAAVPLPWGFLIGGFAGLLALIGGFLFFALRRPRPAARS